MKTAICLVVKNEAVELPYWIAWHSSLGFDSFIIYNDFSDDKTEEVILSLKKGFDIRYKRNHVNRDRHDIRQIRAYNDALTCYGQEFDWIAFFDADEYLDLYGKNIKSYLTSLGDVSLVAFNWCCVGTNGHVSRPEGAPFLNYIKHSDETKFWNRHTKVMFRPDRLEKMYHVHNANVSGRNVNSAGQDVIWEGPHGGLTREQPTWEGGRLFHYQSRSLEHYVNRDRNLEDVRRNENDPLHQVTKDTEYSSIEREIDPNYVKFFRKNMEYIVSVQSENILRTINKTQIGFAASLEDFFSPKAVEIFNPVYEIHEHEIREQWVSLHDSPGNALSEYFSDNEILVFNVKNHFDDYLVCRDGQLAVGTEEDLRIVALYRKGSDYVHLFSPRGEEVNVKDDPRYVTAKTYKIWENRDKTLSFSHPRTGRYMGFTPDGDHNVRKVRALEWENFSSEIIELESCHPSIRAAANYLLSVKDIYSLNKHLHVGNIKKDIVVNAVTELDDVSKKTVLFLMDGVLGEYII